MFWDKIAWVYDAFEKVYNNKVIKGTADICADLVDGSDNVMECACGTGLITTAAAPKAKTYLATDFSPKMLRRAQRKLRECNNVTFAFADITKLAQEDGTYDKVIAGNVIHLLEDPDKALGELLRVAKPGGKVIIPTYINLYDNRAGFLAGVFNRMGANFKRQFDLNSYKKFFAERGFEDVEYRVAEGRMPCAVAVITNK